jgi:Mg-chelatase subunit ChlD
MSPSNEALSVSLSGNPATDRVLITLTPPTRPVAVDEANTTGRTPLDICCVIDVSGSMAASAGIRGVTPDNIGLNVLDIVKHSVKTIVATMQEDDRIALVTFSNQAEIVTDFTRMDAVSKYKLLDDIDRLVPMSSTNLWDGLATGMNLILAAQRPPSSITFTRQMDTFEMNRFTTLFLLTDGMPNVPPRGGHIPALKKYLSSHIPQGVHPFTINTFGFGYSIDTPLLLEIAKIGGGGYNFIPDVGMVGTVFVNAVATAHAAYAQHVKVDVQVLAGITGKPGDFKATVKGQIESVPTIRGIQFDAGDIQYGQPKYFVLELSPSLPPTLRVSATYRPITSNSDAQTNIAELSSSCKPTKEELADIEYHAAAFTLASILLTTTPANRGESANALKDLEARLTSNSAASEHPEAAALARDVGGEAYA